MENKKYLPLKIVHLIFLALGICFYVYSFFQIENVYDNATDKIIAVFQAGTAILALISGFIYLVKGYKKNAAAYFKGYVWIILIADMFAVIVGITEATSYFCKIVWAVALILLAVLAAGKDLGKIKSFAVAGLILLCKVILLITVITNHSILGVAFVPVLLDMIAQIVRTITTGLMVCGKYLDKAARGTK